MGEVLQSFIPKLLAQKGWDQKTFIGKCLLEGLSQDTAYRLVNGETNFTTSSLLIAARVLEVPSLCSLIDIVDPNSEQ